MTDKDTYTNMIEWFGLCSGAVQDFTRTVYDNVQRLRDSGKEIYPKHEDVFKAFELVNPADVKVVIIGQDPYHEPDQAMGLAFSVPDGTPIPRSLKNIFKELKSDIGCDVPSSGNLTSWAKQGVLLLNTVLTVEAHKANSHKNLGWQAFTSSILEGIIRSEKPVVFLCWGAQADSTLKIVLDRTYGLYSNQTIIRSTHPSPLSAAKSTTLFPSFVGSKPFSKANSWLEKQGVTPIDWRL